MKSGNWVKGRSYAVFVLTEEREEKLAAMAVDSAAFWCM
jgi:hypothetical protein